MRPFIVCTVLLAFMVSSVEAGPIMNSVKRLAVQAAPGDCQQPVLAKGEAAAEQKGTGGYIAGGIFLPVIMPLIADAGSSPQPPVIQVQGMDQQTASCYSAAYGEKLKNRKVSAAWKGTWIGIGLVTGLVILAAATTDSYYY